MEKILSFGNSPFSAAILAGILFSMPWASVLAAGNSGHGSPIILLWIALILILAKLSALIERWGQPSVLGELAIGVILGNLALVGINFFEPVKSDVIISFLAELGVIVLLFQIGLESNVRKMKEVGVNAVFVASIGVVAPFSLGAFLVGPWLLPGQDLNTYLFLGAALTATSVGITARIFKDSGTLQNRESQIVLGAAVLDDVLGLIILAVVSAIVTTGAVTVSSIGTIFFQALAFLSIAILLGQKFASKIGLIFSKISTGIGMKFTLAFSFGLIFAYLASLINLAPIVGAFAAGLVLDPVVFRYFRRSEATEELTELNGSISGVDERTKARLEGIIARQNTKHVEDLIEPIAFFLVPVFFVYTGMQVDLATFANLSVLLTALGITVAAFAGKIIAGVAAGKGVNKWIVGVGMIPRGEVGLIFATIGASLGVLTDSVFSIIIIMVILTTLIAPSILSFLINRQTKSKNENPISAVNT